MLRSERGEGQALALRTSGVYWKNRILRSGHGEGVARDRPSPYGPRKEYGKIENEIILLGKNCRFYTANDVIIFSNNQLEVIDETWRIYVFILAFYPRTHPD